MSKSRNQKWYDKEYDDDYDSRNNYGKKAKQQFLDRRKQKQIKNAIRSKNLDYLTEDDERY